MTSSVVFIGSPKSASKQLKNYSQLFVVPPLDVTFRIFASFMPPITHKYRKIYVDFLGPVLAFFLLTSLLLYGYSFKKYKLSITPVESMICYGICMPCLCYILAKLGKSTINFYETISLVGYSLYGHILTILVSFWCFHETSNAFFFVSLTVFGGSSNFRLVLVILKTIPVPGARLLVCSIISLFNMLFLIFLHFGFMHRTFY